MQTIRQNLSILGCSTELRHDATTAATDDANVKLQLSTAAAVGATATANDASRTAAASTSLWQPVTAAASDAAATSDHAA